jgi:integrase
MSVQKLTQEGISKLRCSESKRSEQVCDAQHRGLLLELRRTDPDHPTWYIRYKSRDTGKTRYVRLGHFPDMSLTDARARAKDEQAAIRLGADPRADDDAKKAVPTFSEFFEQQYMPHVRTRKRTAAKDAEYFRLRLKAAFGHERLNQIRRREIQLFHSKLRDEGLAPATCNHYLKLMKRALNLAIQWEIIEGSNPAVGIQQYREMNEVENYLDDKQLKRLLNILQTDKNRIICDIILFLMSTGARCGEALTARWDLIDMEHRTWRIPATNSKSGKVRSVPLNDMALEVLSRQNTKDEFKYVFINRQTKNKYVTIQKVWDRLRKKAGLPFYRIHDCRHFYCSQLVSNGRTLYEVQKIAGHSSPRTTMRYSAISTKALQEASSVAADVLKENM